MKSKAKALAIAKAAASKKALDIVTIDMRKMPSVCDYFVVTSGASTTQVKAIADNIRKNLRQNGVRLRHAEGERDALWVVLDYSDVVAHIFYDETRRFYGLEKLWGDTPQELFKEPKVRTKRPRVKKKTKAAKR